MKVGIKFGKVKKFGIGWCIPHRVVADILGDRVMHFFKILYELN